MSAFALASMMFAGCSGSAIGPREAAPGGDDPGSATQGAGSSARAPQPTTTTSDQVVFRSESPDDGPGFTVALGTGTASPVRCDYFGNYARPNLPRLFATGSYVTINVEESSARTFPIALQIGHGDEVTAMRCAADDRCEGATGGTIELAAASRGGPASGRYQLQFPSGAVAGSFSAIWCGP